MVSQERPPPILETIGGVSLDHITPCVTLPMLRQPYRDALGRIEHARYTQSSWDTVSS